MIVCPNCANEFALAPPCPQCGYTPEKLNGFLAWAPELANQSEGFKAEYFATLAGLEEENFWFRSRNRIILWALKKHFPAMTSYLEVGCGTGYVLSGVADAFPEASIHGSELFSNGLHFASGRVPRASFMQMDARRVPYKNAFDVVGAFDVLEHIAEDETVLEQLHTALKPRGGMVLTVPQHPWLWSQADEHACHERRYTAQELRRKVQAAGFDIALDTSFVTLLLPAMLVSRKKKNQGDYNPLAEFHMSPTFNALLEKILRLEAALIRAGCRFPVGGSRLMVLKRLSS